MDGRSDAIEASVPFVLGGQTYSIYIGLIALSVNLVVSFVGSVVLGTVRGAGTEQKVS